MLEILAIIALCRVNSRNADLRGRNTAWTKAYTVMLWFFFEFGSAVLIAGIFAYAGIDPGFVTYAFALLGAGLGALLSWLIAKRGKPIKTAYDNMTVNETSYVEGSRQLSAPCEVVVIRQKKFAGMAVKTDILLNGQYAGSLGNGEAISFPVYYTRNVVTAKDAFGMRFKTSVPFDAPDGGRVEIVMNAGKFMLHLTRVYQGVAAPVGAPVSGQSGQAHQTHCSYCGAWGFPPAPICPACGSRINE